METNGNRPDSAFSPEEPGLTPLTPGFRPENRVPLVEFPVLLVDEPFGPPGQACHRHDYYPRHMIHSRTAYLSDRPAWGRVLTYSGRDPLPASLMLLADRDAGVAAALRVIPTPGFASRSVG